MIENDWKDPPHYLRRALIHLPQHHRLVRATGSNRMILDKVYVHATYAIGLYEQQVHVVLPLSAVDAVEEYADGS